MPGRRVMFALGLLYGSAGCTGDGGDEDDGPGCPVSEACDMLDPDWPRFGDVIGCGPGLEGRIHGNMRACDDGDVVFSGELTMLTGAEGDADGGCSADHMRTASGCNVAASGIAGSQQFCADVDDDNGVFYWTLTCPPTFEEQVYLLVLE